MKRTPVVLIHGVWFHRSSWERWSERFASYGFAVHVPGWPGEAVSATADRRREPHRDPGLEALIAHYEGFVRSLDSRPVLVGHSVGGLVVQHLLGAGLGRAAVALAPWPGDGLPAEGLAVMEASAELSGSSFRTLIANTLEEDEAAQLFERHAVHAPRRLLADLGFGPDSAPAGTFRLPRIVVDTSETARGPLLLISGQEDLVIPDAVTRAGYKAYGDCAAVTDLKQFADRGHSLVIDNGWPAVADYVLIWLAANGIEAATEED